jgi:hypothetical protein
LKQTAVRGATARRALGKAELEALASLGEAELALGEAELAAHASLGEAELAAHASLGEAELAAHASLGEAELAAHVEKSRGTHGREGTSLSLASRGGLGAVKGALPLRQREQRVRHWRQETIE